MNKRTNRRRSIVGGQGSPLDDRLARTINQRYETLAKALTFSAFKVYLHLVDLLGEGKSTCYPSIPTVAAATQLSERSVQYAITELKKCGLLTIQHRFLDSSIYTVYPLEAMAGATPIIADRDVTDQGQGGMVQKVSPGDGAKGFTGGWCKRLRRNGKEGASGSS